MGIESFDERAHSFIVRIWHEPRELKGAVPEWRGVIEHISSGKRRYFRHINEVTNFMEPYLNKIEFKSGTNWRLRKILSLLKQRYNECQ